MSASAATVSQESVATCFSNASVTIDTSVTAQAAAAGLKLDMPVLIWEKGALMIEVGGVKGEGAFGSVTGGLFYRHWFEKSGTTAGGGVFYDALRDTDGFSYSQIGVSAEISRGLFTLRGNGYFPVGKYASDQLSQTDDILNGVVGFWNNVYRREAMSGWNVELEMAIPSKREWLQPSVAVGYYQWNARDARYSGVSTRASAKLWRRVTADVEWRSGSGGLGQEWRAGLRVEIPLGRRSTLAAVAAGPDGKGIIELEHDGKTMRPLSSGKSVVPMESAAPKSGLPADFFKPMYRVSSPTVSRSLGRTWDPPATATPVAAPVAAADPDCGCTVGNVIIID
jgi:hypothetical protein